MIRYNIKVLQVLERERADSACHKELFESIRTHSVSIWGVIASHGHMGGVDDFIIRIKRRIV
jgi:hypothetical protein